MGSFELGGKVYQTDEDGYLANIDDWNMEAAGYLADRKEWNKDVAQYLAKEEDVDMTDAHWEIVVCLREYYEEYGSSLNVNQLKKVVGKKFGSKKGDTKYLYGLFPRSPGAQACKIAGLPKPQGCN